MVVDETVYEKFLWCLAELLPQVPKPLPTNFFSRAFQTLYLSLWMFFFGFFNISCNLQPVHDMVSLTEWNLQRLKKIYNLTLQGNVGLPRMESSKLYLILYIPHSVPCQKAQDSCRGITLSLGSGNTF